MADHSRLGRGLASLMGEVAEESPSTDSTRKPRKAPIENLVANPRNPRRSFTEAELNELTESIKERGIIQPIVVRQLPDNKTFEIIAGERRWRAAQRAGLHEVPIAIVDATRPISNRSNSPSSKTCSAPTSIRSRKRPAMSR